MTTTDDGSVFTYVGIAFLVGLLTGAAGLHLYHGQTSPEVAEKKISRPVVQGEPDSKGITEAPSLDTDEINLETTHIEVKPDGVPNERISEVISAQPHVTVSERSESNDQQIDRTTDRGRSDSSDQQAGTGHSIRDEGKGSIGTPELVLEPFSLIVSDSGRVFSKDLLEGRLSLSVDGRDYEWDLEIDPRFSVVRRSQPSRSRETDKAKTISFSSNLALGLHLTLPDLNEPVTHVGQIVSPALHLEFLQINRTHLDVHAGLSEAGLGLGDRLSEDGNFSSTSLYAGAGVKYRSVLPREPVIVTPVLGVSIRF